jgi:hypothetical protein
MGCTLGPPVRPGGRRLLERIAALASSKHSKGQQPRYLNSAQGKQARKTPVQKTGWNGGVETPMLHQCLNSELAFAGAGEYQQDLADFDRKS